MNTIFKTHNIAFAGILIIIIIGMFLELNRTSDHGSIAGVETQKESYWFLLYRKSNVEKFYKGIPGDPSKSTLIKTFTVKSGVPGEKPTPLPQLLGKKYWKIVDKVEAFDNEETAPYFLTLDVPISEEEPFGPTPYLECEGQCNWILPGYFGLHGTAGNEAKLSDEDPGSSGCIRHTDEDITYLYNLLDPENEEIRYYIQDI
jgi:hypothetical protein